MPYNQELDHLILRIGDEEGVTALRKPDTKPLDITGKPMKGWIMVEQAALTDTALGEWLLKAKRFVQTLQPK